MNSRRLTALGATVLAALVVLAPHGAPIAHADTVASADPAAAPGVTWALQPGTDGLPDGRVSLRHTADPGETLAESLVLTNFSPQPAAFAVYASDGTVTGEGSFDLIPDAEESTGGGSWVALGAVEGAAPRDDGIAVTLDAGASVVIPLTVSVPSDASPGDHPAGIVAELLPDAATEVQIASRVGVRLHLRVSGDVAASARPDAVQASYEPSWNPFAPGILTVRYDVANTGNVRVGTESVVRVAGPFGALAVEPEADVRREILPGQTSPAEVRIPVWPLLLVEGSARVQPSAVGEDVIESALAAASSEFTAWTIPWSQLALIAGVILLVLGIRRARSRATTRMQARIDAAVASARAEDAGSTAD